MKTLTINSATKNLQKLTDKNLNKFGFLTKNAFAYKVLLNVINGSKKVRPAYYNGSGKWTSLQDHTLRITTLLTKMGIEFTLTNDSFSGKSPVGNLITITTKIK